MKGIKNKKCIMSETNCHTHIQFMVSERKTVKVFSCLAYAHAPAGDLRQAL
jgi:hypothetical protein